MYLLILCCCFDMSTNMSQGFFFFENIKKKYFHFKGVYERKREVQVRLQTSSADHGKHCDIAEVVQSMFGKEAIFEN